MPARRRPAESQGSPSTNTQNSTYSSPRGSRSKSISQKNEINNNDNEGMPYINSPKYTAYLRERNSDFSREEAFLRAMQDSDFWNNGSSLSPPVEPPYQSYDYPNGENNTTFPDSKLPEVDNNVINTREINSTNDNGSIINTPWNPLKSLINFLVGLLAFILNVIGSIFFYIYWVIRETPNFVWKNLTENENGPFIETIVGIDRNVPPQSSLSSSSSFITNPNYIIIAVTNVRRNNKLFWLFLIPLIALLLVTILSFVDDKSIFDYFPHHSSTDKFWFWPLDNSTYTVQPIDDGNNENDIAEKGSNGKAVFTMDDLRKLIAAEVENSNKNKNPTIPSSNDRIRSLINTEIKSEVKKEMASYRTGRVPLRGEEMMEIIRKEARKVVSEELLVFSQDKLNKPDFALYSGGAKVISRYTSKTYEVWPEKWYSRMFAQFSGQGILRGKPPVTAISPDTHVGQCWPFPGHEGQLAILLNRRVHVTAVTYDHVSKDVAVDVLSAPREFEVWGIVDDGTGGRTKQPDNNDFPDVESIEEDCGDREDGEYDSVRSNNLPGQSSPKALEADPSIENSTSGELKLGSSPLHHFLGRFSYDINGLPVQTFEVSEKILKSNKPVRAIIMKVLNNWGKPSYTCLYRFRVHGDPVDKLGS
ncbi:Spindle pole body associated protein [Gigaspora margarita]|uniref:Spindle pole body associated protein n=1 Tax=Gigaspora margarita TaxID=4874 RepID=A0A8H3X2N8_GIGMA|nr:Spindle pole body associated protein [Gigaspora margarita]